MRTNAGRWIAAVGSTLVALTGCARSGFDVVVHARCEDSRACPRGSACVDGVCREETWFSLCGSDLGPWSVRAGGSDWGGGISGTIGASDNPSLATDGRGDPVVAWDDDTLGPKNICVRRFDGEAWVDVGGATPASGGISRNSGQSAFPSLVLDSRGQPVVAWEDDTPGQSEIYVKRFDGSAWVDVGPSSSTGGGVSDTAGASVNPALAMTGSGALLVAWSEAVGGGTEIYVRRFDGTSWGELGAGSASGGGVSADTTGSGIPALAVGPAGQVVLAWTGFSGGQQNDIFVKQYDGAAWTEMGAGSASGEGISTGELGSSTRPAVVVGAGIGPVVAWQFNSASVSSDQIYVKRFDGSQWVEMGTSSATGGGVSDNCCDAYRPDLALGPGDAPVMAWHAEQGAIGDNEVYVRRFDGTAWREVGVGSAADGGVSNNNEDSQNAAIAIGPAGEPIVAWSDLSSGNSEILVRQFDSSVWTGVGPSSPEGGGIGRSTEFFEEPSLAMDQQGNPVVAWSGVESGASGIYLARFDGACWEDLGIASTGVTGTSLWPSLALSVSGEPRVAWMSIANNQHQVFGRHWSDVGWVDLSPGSAAGGGLSNLTDEVWLAAAPRLVTAPDDHSVLAWYHRSILYDSVICVRSEGASTWSPVGGSSSTGDCIAFNDAPPWYAPSLAVNAAGELLLAWTESAVPGSEIVVRRFDGSAWVDVGGASLPGGVSNNPGWSFAPSLVVDRAGHLIVAWQDDSSGSMEILVKRFDGTAWTEVGEGSASGGGISENAGYSGAPQLALDARDRPIVAWENNALGTREIYLRRFDGTAWVEVGAASASGGGISNSAAVSRAPRLAVEAEVVCVIWVEAVRVGNALVMRCAALP